MGSFGARLQREREMRSVTLEEIAEATKIGTRSLRALEEQDFEKLPGGIFNKGFVRAYARYLGLDEDQAVADYLTALSEAQAAGKVTRQESALSSPGHEKPIFTIDDDDSEPVRLPVGMIVLLVVLAALLFGGWKYFSKHGFPKLPSLRAAMQPQRRQRAPKPPAVTPNTSRPAANPLAMEAFAEPLAPAGLRKFVVRVKAREPSWVSIIADGKTVMSGILPLAAEKSVDAQRSVVLKTGNAAGIELYHNDKLVPAPGSAGQVKTLEFTMAGLKK